MVTVNEWLKEQTEIRLKLFNNDHKKVAESLGYKVKGFRLMANRLGFDMPVKYKYKRVHGEMVKVKNET